MRHPMDAALDRLPAYPPGFRLVDLENDFTAEAQRRGEEKHFSRDSTELVEVRWTQMNADHSSEYRLHLVKLHSYFLCLYLC